MCNRENLSWARTMSECHGVLRPEDWLVHMDANTNPRD